MVEKLTKKQLISEIKQLKEKANRCKLINYISTIVAIILGVVLIFTTVAPAFSGINVTYGGKNIILSNDKNNGSWELIIETTGFTPANNINIHVKFLDENAEINYGTLFFSIVPDERKLESTNEFEYKWYSYKGEIVIFVNVSSSARLVNNTFVQISTDRGLEYRHWGY